MERDSLKLLNIEITNFGSYDSLNFDFQNLGLCLIYGTTGSGKSTLLDASSWTLFGQTSKGGNADEVRSWLTPDTPTTGILQVETQTGKITITRIRGKSNQNDLYYTEESNPEVLIRGKDLTETQKRLNQRLGVDYDLYLAASYFSEYSPTASFFLAKSKDQREIFENIADLTLPVKLAERTSDAKKEANKELKVIQDSYTRESAKLDELRRSSSNALKSSQKFDLEQSNTLSAITGKAKNFEVEKASKIAAAQTKADNFEAKRFQSIRDLGYKIDKLALKVSQADTKKCPTCGNCKEPISHYLEKLDSAETEIIKLSEEPNYWLTELENAQKLENHYEAQLAEFKLKINPFVEQIANINKDIEEAEFSINTQKASLSVISNTIAALTHLNELSFELRGELLKKAVKEAEASTNQYLETYFDAEMRVEFNIEGADSFKVSIQKNGHECVYRQLSRGQRSLLRLCFVVSIMKASANKAGIHFSNLFMDEVLDGLSADLKVKAYGLFESLELDHESIILIDHEPGFQALFNKRYNVTINGDISTIREEENE